MYISCYLIFNENKIYFLENWFCAKVPVFPDLFFGLSLNYLKRLLRFFTSPEYIDLFSYHKIDNAKVEDRNIFTVQKSDKKPNPLRFACFQCTHRAAQNLKQ